ncbi:MAG: (Fe-S)-binding protein [Promethearchaeota archaeon]
MEYRNLEKYAEDLFLCARCGDCSLADKTVASGRDVFHPCAVKNVLGFEAYTSRGRIMIMNDLLAGKLEVDEDLVSWAYSCTTCRNCQETCTATAEGIRLPEMSEALRNDLVEAGYGFEKHIDIENSIMSHYNPYKEDHEMRHLVFGERQFQETAEVVFFVGCTSSVREKEIALSTVQLLDKMNIDYTILQDERCCGSVLLRLGRKDAFEGLTRHNIEAVKNTGAKVVVTACAGCFRTWKIDIPQSGHEYDFRVLHITEFLDQLVREGKVSFGFADKIRVTYHDPCHLGRHSEVYEAPRRVIESVGNVELVEMVTNRRYAHCCGAGGGVKSSHGELAERIAADRVREAEDTSSDILITACPFCFRGLRDGARSIDSKLEILELTTFLLNAETGDRMLSMEDHPLKSHFMSYLSDHPKIFEGLKAGAVIDYGIEGSRFHVEVTGKSEIQVYPVRGENPDVELSFSPGAVKQLITYQSEDEYAANFGRFFKEPTDEEWIRFNLRRNIVKLLMKGYRKFAQKAGLI